MTHTNDPNDRLERLTAEVLRELPPRRAPRTLEARVLAELERRAAKPWWQSSFMEWPALVRILFVLASIVTGVLAVRGSTWLFGIFSGCALPGRRAVLPFAVFSSDDFFLSDFFPARVSFAVFSAAGFTLVDFFDAVCVFGS